MKAAIELKFSIERPARKGGGDRYQCDKDENFKVYVPQYISRSDETIEESLTITFS